MQILNCATGASALLFVLFGLAQPVRAQENVTVPKSRLEELERKEKELERLKGELDKPKKDNVPPKQQSQKAAAAPLLPAPSEPMPAYVSPALESLPAVQPYQTVESMDLANYYHADSGAADRHFRKQKLTVRGEIVGFEKPVWKRNYRIVLKSPMRETKVICDLLPPEKSNAVFTTHHGEELIAIMGETRVPIAKVGQIAVIKGECKGRSDSDILIVGWDLKLSQ